MTSIAGRLRSALRVKEGTLYGLEGAQTQDELSRQLVRLVDVLYALVLVQGAIYYRRIFTIGSFFDDPSRWVPVCLALVLIYFMTVQSFIDYHLAAEDQKYRTLDKAHRVQDLVRFYLDVLIVGSYSFLLLKAHVLIDTSKSDLSAVFWALPAIFLLYYLWGLLRSGFQSPYSPRLLMVTGGLYLVLAGIYTEESPSSLRNAAAFGAAIFLLLSYRVLNWPQNRTLAS